ncbi:hypothetical protein ACWIGM_12545 [Bosea sp. NPDC055332]
MLQTVIVGVGCLLLLRLLDAYSSWQGQAALRLVAGWGVIYLALAAPLYFLACRDEDHGTETTSAPKTAHPAEQIFGMGFFGVIGLLLLGHYLTRI